LGKGGAQATGHGNECDALALEDGQDGSKFVALAAVRNGEHQVHVFDHAQIAMAGLGRMDKQGRRACRSQGRRRLAPHMPTFAHAHDDHAPPDLKHGLYGPSKLGANTVDELLHRRGFDGQGLAPKRQHALDAVLRQRRQR